jgi:hypothetical protein
MYYKLLTNFAFSQTPDGLTTQEKRCFGAHTLVGGFLKACQLAYEAYVDASKDYTVKNFEDLFRHYRPELWQLIERDDERLKLKKWLGHIHQHSQMPIRIISAKDDFLNLGLSWQEFLQETKLTPAHLILTDFGGHSGMIGISEFDGLLKRAIFSN